MAWRLGQSNFAPNYQGNQAPTQDFNNKPRPFPGSMQQQPAPEPMFVQPVNYDYSQTNGYPQYDEAMQQPYMDQQDYGEQREYYDQPAQDGGMNRNPREDVEMEEDFPSYKELRSVFLRKQRESQDGSRPASSKVWKPKTAVSLSSEYQPSYKTPPQKFQKPPKAQPNYSNPATNYQPTPSTQFSQQPAAYNNQAVLSNPPSTPYINQSPYQAPQTAGAPQPQYSPAQQYPGLEQYPTSPQQSFKPQYSSQQSYSSQKSSEKPQYTSQQSFSSQQSIEMQDQPTPQSYHQKPPAPRRQNSKTIRVLSRHSTPQSTSEFYQTQTPNSGHTDIPIEVSHEYARRPTMLYPRPARPSEDQVDFIQIGRPRRRNLSGGMHVAISPSSPHSSILSSGQTSPKVVVTSNSARSPQIARYRPDTEDYWTDNQTTRVIHSSPGVAVMNSPGHQPRRRTSYAEINVGSNSSLNNFRPRSNSVIVGMRGPFVRDSLDYFSPAGINNENVFSQARNQGWSATVGGVQPVIRTGPQVYSAPSGPGPRARHAQFNSPMGLYSTQNAQNALDQSIPQGTAAADTIKITGEKSEPKIQHTPTLQMVLREDFVKKMTGHKPSVKFYKQAHEYGPGYGPLRQYVEHYME